MKLNNLPQFQVLVLFLLWVRAMVFAAEGKHDETLQDTGATFVEIDINDL